MRDSMKATRIKELKDLLRHAESYRQLKPLLNEMNAIKWKGKRQKFKEAHEQELRLLYVTQRKLKTASDAEGHGRLSYQVQQSESEREGETKKAEDNMTSIV